MTFGLFPTPAWSTLVPMRRVGDASSTTTVVTLPAGVVDGDLMLGVGYSDNNTTLSTPSGWTLISRSSHSYTNSTYGTTKYQAMAVWYRIAASEGATVTLDGELTGVVVYRNGTGINVSSAYAFVGLEQVDPSTIEIPSVTVTQSGFLLAFVCQSGNVAIDVVPSGLTLIESRYDSGNAAPMTLSIYEQKRGTGATGNKTFTADTASPADSPGMAGILVHVY